MLGTMRSHALGATRFFRGHFSPITVGTARYEQPGEAISPS